MLFDRNPIFDANPTICAPARNYNRCEGFVLIEQNLRQIHVCTIFLLNLCGIYDLVFKRLMINYYELFQRKNLLRDFQLEVKSSHLNSVTEWNDFFFFFVSPNTYNTNSRLTGTAITTDRLLEREKMFVFYIERYRIHRRIAALTYATKLSAYRILRISVDSLSLWVRFLLLLFMLSKTQTRLIWLVLLGIEANTDFFLFEHCFSRNVQLDFR